MRTACIYPRRHRDVRPGVVRRAPDNPACSHGYDRLSERASDAAGKTAMHYLAFGRYNAQGAAGVIKDGLTSRKEVLKPFAEASGARLVGMWGVESSDLDFVILVEGDTPPAQGAANGLGQMSMGHLAEVHTYTLVETEDVDAAVRAHNPVTRAPGEA